MCCSCQTNTNADGHLLRSKSSLSTSAKRFLISRRDGFVAGRYGVHLLILQYGRADDDDDDSTAALLIISSSINRKQNRDTYLYAQRLSFEYEHGDIGDIITAYIYIFLYILSI